MDPVVRGRGFVGDPDQRARLELGAALVNREQTHAEPLEQRLAQEPEIVDHEARAKGARKGVAAGDPDMLVERVDALATMREVARARDHDPAQPAELADHELGLGPSTEAQDQIQTFVAGIERACAEHQLDVDLGLSEQERVDARGQEAGPELAQRPDPQEPVRAPTIATDRVLGLGDVGRDPQAMLVEGRAALGQRDPSRRSLEQLDAEALLELRDLAADRRLGQPEYATRGGEAAGLDHLGEDDQLVEIGLESVHCVRPRAP